MNVTTKAYKGWKIEFDRDQAIAMNASDDPGNFDPVTVTAPNGDCGSDNCALHMGEVEYTRIPDDVYQWIESEVCEFWDSLD